MAAKSKKRLSKIEKKIIELDKLQLEDVLCSICQSILVKPVSLPCLHVFCHSCFIGSVENNALCCPLCRLRIGSWLRTATNQKSLVNEKLWKHIQTKFSHEIYSKINGEDIHLPEEKPIFQLSAPGEIRREYKAELDRLRKERMQLEEKHLEETELLIKKIQEEEEEAHKKYLEALKKDEIIAQQMQNHLVNCDVPSPNTSSKFTRRSTKPRLKDTKIDGYLSKINPSSKTVENSPMITDDNTTSTDCSTPNNRLVNGSSPEMVPTYSKMMKTAMEKKIKLVSGIWNKENGDRQIEKKEDPKIICKKSSNTEENRNKVKLKNNIPSLLVSLPLHCSGILQQKAGLLEALHRKGADSVDSMRQELLYFKPIDEITTTSATKGVPLRVPGVRPTEHRLSPAYKPPPTGAQYLESLCNLRQLSLKKKLPSAFVIALEILRVYKKENPTKCDKLQSKAKKRKSTSPAVVPSVPTRRNPNRNKQIKQNNSSTQLNKCNLRRTRSMGSISKFDNETTPKKAKIIKQRKAESENKPYLRSDSKKSAKKEYDSPLLYSETLNNNKVNLAVKNLSSPFKSCDVKHIYQEQLRIEKMIEQEKTDYDLARKMEEEWNKRGARRVAKRQVTLNYALRPAKKLKV